MTLVLELPPIVETQLRADASAQGVALETLALETLAFTRFRGDATAREAARLWARLVDPKTHNDAIHEIAAAPAKVRAVIDAKSEAAATAYYATPEGEGELADWRALEGLPFHEPADETEADNSEAGSEIS